MVDEQVGELTYLCYSWEHVDVYAVVWVMMNLGYQWSEKRQSEKRRSASILTMFSHVKTSTELVL